MLRRSITCLLAVGAVSALLTLSPPTAHAIPVSGDYVFTTGITGSFTSNGTKLTAWDFVLDGSAVTWRHDNTTQVVLANDGTAWFAQDTQATKEASIIWGLSAAGIDDLLDRVTFNTISISYKAASVPEPSAGLLLLVGLVMLVGYRWQQQRQTGLQVG